MRTVLANIKSILTGNRLLAGNIAGVLALKGLGLILSLFSMPLYMDYFDNQVVLGVWFTILSVINWIVSFDLGIGNGLRNNLTIAIAQNDRVRMRQVISSGYYILGLVSLMFLSAVWLSAGHIDWNSFFNVSLEIVSVTSLRKVVTVTLSGLVISFFLRLVTSINAAIQFPVINNIISFITSLLLIVWLLIAKPSEDPVGSMMRMSWAYSLIVNIPLLVTTVITFCLPILKGCSPNARFINRDAVRSVMYVGIVFFILQILFMIISVTNEWFVSKFFSPDDVVDYQIYNRLFQALTNIFMLILMPIVAAVTKAFAEGRLEWIRRMKGLLYGLTVAASVVQILLAVFLQPIVDFWLGDKTIPINHTIAAIFVFTSIVRMWVSVQSAIVTGLNRLKLQLAFFLFAVPFKIVFILIGVRYDASWVVVVLSTGLCLLPYGLVQPFAIERLLKRHQATK